MKKLMSFLGNLSALILIGCGLAVLVAITLRLINILL